MLPCFTNQFITFLITNKNLKQTVPTAHKCFVYPTIRVSVHPESPLEITQLRVIYPPIPYSSAGFGPSDTLLHETLLFLSAELLSSPISVCFCINTHSPRLRHYFFLDVSIVYSCLLISIFLFTSYHSPDPSIFPISLKAAGFLISDGLSPVVMERMNRREMRGRQPLPFIFLFTTLSNTRIFLDFYTKTSRGLFRFVSKDTSLFSGSCHMLLLPTYNLQSEFHVMVPCVNNTDVHVIRRWRLVLLLPSAVRCYYLLLVASFDNDSLLTFLFSLESKDPVLQRLLRLISFTSKPQFIFIHLQNTPYVPNANGLSSSPACESSASAMKLARFPDSPHFWLSLTPLKSF